MFHNEHVTEKIKNKKILKKDKHLSSPSQKNDRQPPRSKKRTPQAPSQKNKLELPSLDFIAGLIVGAGSFMLIKQNNNLLPVFQLKMHQQERPLFELIVKRLGLKETIYDYTHRNRNYALILVRRASTIRNVIIPTFDQRLFGKKKTQFEQWRDNFNIKMLSKEYMR